MVPYVVSEEGYNAFCTPLSPPRCCRTGVADLYRIRHCLSAGSAGLAQSTGHDGFPYAPGGSTDLVARLIAPGLGAALGQPVLVENMAGVGGIAGVSRVAKAAPD